MVRNIPAMGWQIRPEIEKHKGADGVLQWVFKIYMGNSEYPEYTSKPYPTIESLKRVMRAYVNDLEVMYKREETKE